MNENRNSSEKNEANKNLMFENEDLSDIKITDTDLDSEDEKVKAAKKMAKKQSKAYRSEQQLKQAKLKKYFIIAVAIAAAALLLGLIPASRWFILNSLGQRSPLVLKFVEPHTKKPIINAKVTVNKQSSLTTNGSGLVRFTGVKFGTQNIEVQKTGYARVQEQVINSFGKIDSKPLEIKVIGIKVDILVSNWLSSEPINQATIQSGQAKTKTNIDGEASLVIAPTESEKVEITITSAGYNKKVFQTNLNSRQREVSLVSANKNYFVSNRDGKLDIFSSNLDGSSEKKIIKATGKETPSIFQLEIHQDNKKAILVADREGKQLNGRYVAGVYLVNLADGTLQKIDEGGDVRIIGWSDNSLIYQKGSATHSYTSPSFTNLKAYNIHTKTNRSLAVANYFSVAYVVGNKVIYQPADPYHEIKNNSLTSLDIVTGERKEQLRGQHIRYATMPLFGILEFETASSRRYRLNILSESLQQIERAPSSSRNFTFNYTNKSVIWTERRDGQGVLLYKKNSSAKEQTIVKAAGLTTPIRFLSASMAVVRIVTNQETADYIVHIPTHKITKITDVENIGGSQY